MVVCSITLLVCIDISAATWSPSRGGSTILEPLPPQELEERQCVRHEHEQRRLEQTKRHLTKAKINLNTMFHSLRHTSEINLKLLQGVKYWGGHRKHPKQDHQHIELHENGCENLPVNVHPSRHWQAPIRASSDRFVEEAESLFHAKIPRHQSTLTSDWKGNEQQLHNDEWIRYWGPDLLQYLENVVDLLGMNKNDVEIVVAMIYMDRACSVETPRSNGVPACPFCAPRTIHRLSLAALVIARQALREESEHIDLRENEEMYIRLSSSLGIPLSQLEIKEMVEWMRYALGDDGLFVTSEEMRTWTCSLETIFSSSYPKN